MKKLITFGTICILACIVLSSCSSNFAITKRHYNKGYYIDRSGNKEMALVKKEKANRAAIATTVYPAKTLAGRNLKGRRFIQQTKPANTLMLPIAKKTESKLNLVTRNKQITQNHQANKDVTGAQTVQSTSVLNSIKDDGGDHSRRSALSLFWLIILIILILWAVGLLAGGLGLGGFINILLVIALILLILWLLRII